MTSEPTNESAVLGTCDSQVNWHRIKPHPYKGENLYLFPCINWKPVAPPEKREDDSVHVPQLVRDMMATVDTEIDKIRILQAWARTTP